MEERQGLGPPLDPDKCFLAKSIETSCGTLQELLSKNLLPVEYIINAKGLVFMKTKKVGFGVSMTQGYGLIIARDVSSSHGWSPPLPIKIEAFSVGASFGFAEQSSMIALADEDDVKIFLKDKAAMKLGIDFGLKLMDKVDKSKTKTINPDAPHMDEKSGLYTRSFTLSKGLMVDVSLKGATVEPDFEDIANSYGEQVTVRDVLTSRITPPSNVVPLYTALANVISGSSAC